MFRVQTMDFIEPQWPAPANILALSTTRGGGYSKTPFAGLNLGHHVGDVLQSVSANRDLLYQRLPAHTRLQWLQQVHGTTTVKAGASNPSCDADNVTADACYTTDGGVACAVLTADCLPVLFCSRSGDQVAAAHGGWRGLANGVLESCVDSMRVPPSSLMAWLGPAIGPMAFEVGEEVRAEFITRVTPSYQRSTMACFSPARSRPGHYMADLYGLARLRLQALGLTAIYGGGYCTFSAPERFFSYRRDGQTGRMATLIMIKSCHKTP